MHHVIAAQGRTVTDQRPPHEHRCGTAMPHRCAWETAHTDHIERRPRGRIPIVGAATGARRPTGVTHCIVLISHRGLGRSKCNHTAFLRLLLAGNPRGQRPACARSTRRAAEKRRQGERQEKSGDAKGARTSVQRMHTHPSHRAAASRDSHKFRGVQSVQAPSGSVLPEPV